MLNLRAVSFGFLLMCNAELCKAQEAELSFDKQIFYKMSYQADSSDIESKRSEIMELLVNDSVSIFQSNKLGLRDSLIRELHFKGSTERLDGESASNTRTPIMYSILFHNQKFLYQENYTFASLNKDRIKAYEEGNNVLKWVLQEDTMSINGIFCQKALLHYGGRDWIAWFTTDIPFPFGPYKFNGLPGLLIKVCDKSNSWLFELIGIQNTTRIVKLPSPQEIKQRLVSKSEFYKQKRFFVENETVIREQEGLLSFPNNSVRKNMIHRDKEKSQKDNNWIELYP